MSLPNTGSYWWVASYSGDPNTSTLPSKSGCASEPLTVTGGWKDGDLTTYDQVDWVTNEAAIELLFHNFPAVYASVGGNLVVGDHENFVLVFSESTNVSDYLPSSGPAAALDSTLINPFTTSSGIFGGDVVTLKLDVDFSDAGLLPGTSGLKFGDLTLCNFSDPSDINGVSVWNFLGVIEKALGGDPTTDSIKSLQAVADPLGAAFTGGFATTFAQEHLVNGPCP